MYVCITYVRYPDINLYIRITIHFYGGVYDDYNFSPLIFPSKSMSDVSSLHAKVLVFC